ncbi:hypothetical protein ES703_98259 [subsurface metagenome]
MSQANVDMSFEIVIQFLHIDLRFKNKFCRFHRAIHISSYAIGSRFESGYRKRLIIKTAKYNLRTTGIVLPKEELQSLWRDSDFRHNFGFKGQYNPGFCLIVALDVQSFPV